MDQSATSVTRFAVPAPLPLEASFDGGHLTSDGDLPWLNEAESALGLCAAFAACIREWRRGPVRHTLQTLVRLRIFQIARGYMDQNDADTPRADPLLTAVCGRLPETGIDLASQPTLSRLENAVDRTACHRLAGALGEVYLRERERTGVSRHFIASTDDPTNGKQEGTAYHGFYPQHLYHPMLCFDGDTDQLITAVLRRGTAHASTGAVTPRGRSAAAGGRAATGGALGAATGRGRLGEPPVGPSGGPRGPPLAVHPAAGGGAGTRGCRGDGVVRRGGGGGGDRGWRRADDHPPGGAGGETGAEGGAGGAATASPAAPRRQRGPARVLAPGAKPDTR